MDVLLLLGTSCVCVLLARSQHCRAPAGGRTTCCRSLRCGSCLCKWTPRTCLCPHAYADHMCTSIPLQAAGRRVAGVCAAKAARAHGRHGHACLRRGPWLCADLRTAHHAGVLKQQKLIESVSLVRLVGSWTSQTFFCAKRTLALCRPVYVPPIMQVC